MYVFECKAIHSKNASIDDYMYKLGAITRDFGLKVNSYLLVLKNFPQRRLVNIRKRQKILGIKGIFFANDFMNADNMIKNIKE